MQLVHYIPSFYSDHLLPELSDLIYACLKLHFVQFWILNNFKCVAKNAIGSCMSHN